jgi:diketogulonate reductase-like aldo/keto reductase
MNIPTKKLKNGFELPVYGLGLWQMGGRWEADYSKDRAEVDAIRAAIEMGVTHIDTAESYGDGHAEELLREALSGVDRSKLTIATKVSGNHQKNDQLRASFDASLNRMGLEYVDLYLLHRFPESGTDIKDTMKALDSLVDDGLVKNIGVCNLSPHRLKVAQSYSAHPIVCNQVHYNVQYREAEKQGVLKQCQKEDIMLVAWRPVQKGLLPAEGLMQELSRKYGKTLNQIAINWLISQKNVVTISKTSSIEHLRENLGALNWELEASDVERIRVGFHDQKSVSDAVPLDYKADVEAW